MWEVIIISIAILKMSQLVDEIIKKIPAAMLNRLSGVTLLTLQLFVVSCHCWYNANLNKAVTRGPT